ncbi:hypothetical protein CQJ94_01345 [Glycomyces fuscus]|nr:hypothetical protein CQJ94_01345 [Glycomyces fuscus]
MAHIARVPLDSGATVEIEIADDADSIEPVGRRGRTAVTAAQTLNGALEQVTPAIEAVVGTIRERLSAPDRISVQFGVKLTAETSAVITKAAAEANFTITVEWNRGDGGGNGTARP